MTLVEAGPRMDSNSGVLGVQKVLIALSMFSLLTSVPE